jgi:hypothetical protein
MQISPRRGAIGSGTSDEHPAASGEQLRLGCGVDGGGGSRASPLSELAASLRRPSLPLTDGGGSDDGQLPLVVAAAAALSSPAVSTLHPPMVAPTAARPGPVPSPTGGAQLPLVVRRPCDSPVANRAERTAPTAAPSQIVALAACLLYCASVVSGAGLRRRRADGPRGAAGAVRRDAGAVWW